MFLSTSSTSFLRSPLKHHRVRGTSSDHPTSGLPSCYLLAHPVFLLHGSYTIHKHRYFLAPHLPLFWLLIPRLRTQMCVCVQSCLTLCHPTDCSPQSSSVHEIFQTIMLKWLPFPMLGDLPDPGV